MGSVQERDIVAVGDHASSKPDVLSVLWAITKACQFSCSYCVYDKSPRGAEYSSREQLLRGARTLLRMGRPGCQITLYGGEPTLHPYFNDLLDFFVAAQAPVSLRMYTNGTRSARFHEEMVARTGRYPFLVIFSLHLESANFRKFFQAVEITARGGMSVGVSFMFDPARRDHARNCLNELLALRAALRGQRLTDNGALMVLTWAFGRCPREAKQELLRAAVCRAAGRPHPFLAPLGAHTVVVQGLGRVISDAELLREAIPLAANQLGNTNFLAALAALVSRPSSSPLVLHHIESNHVMQRLSERVGVARQSGWDQRGDQDESPASQRQDDCRGAT